MQIDSEDRSQLIRLTVLEVQMEHLPSRNLMVEAQFGDFRGRATAWVDDSALHAFLRALELEKDMDQWRTSGARARPILASWFVANAVIAQGGAIMKRMLQLVVASLSLSLAPVEASSQTLQPEWIPDAVRVPPGHELFFQALAVGVQIYDCQATKSGFEWVFRSPEAVLFNGSAQLLGTHFAGPTWQSLDGSRVIGARVAAADAANPSSIPWLLLRASSHEGTGTFSNVTYIQRLLTGAGTAPPADACDKTHSGEEARSSYIATYYFYVAAK